ncbi:MAG TPA: BatD family protein [Candidatus Binatia bacterium]|nr:BatD family protein [Candidatus Binatia bacterium]
MKKTGNRRLITAAWLLLFLPGAVCAIEAEVTASINAEKVGLDDTLIYTVTFKNIAHPVQPDLSHWEDFKTLQTSRSSEFQFSNGASITSTRFIYYLMPVRTGKLALPPIHYRHEGRDYRTQPLTVEVVKGTLNPRPSPPAQQPGPFDEDFFASPFQDRQSQKVDTRLQAVISKTNCIQGEQLLFRVLLYTRNRIEAVNMVSSPSFAGFWQEWYPVPKSISASSENVNGVIYQVYEIRKAALFASESGTLTIPALQFELQLADGSAVFFGSTPLRRSTQPLMVNASALPAAAAGLPVGQFYFSLTRPQPTAGSNDIVTLFMVIGGNGNCKTIIPPTFQNDDMIRVYPAKISHENSYGPLALNGIVRVEIPVAFNGSGDIHFPSLEFKFFNPESRSLVSLRSEPLQLHVRSDKPRTDGSMTLPQSTILRESEDIDFIKTGAVTDQGYPFYRQGWYAAVIVLLFSVNFLFLLKITVWQRYILTHPLLKNRQLLGLTLRRLDRVRHYEEIATILDNYCREKSGLGFAEISDRKISELFRRHGVGAGDSEKFIFIKNQAELAKFSPLKKTQTELKNDLQSLRTLLKGIDRKLK